MFFYVDFREGEQLSRFIHTVDLTQEQFSSGVRGQDAVFRCVLVPPLEALLRVFLQEQSSMVMFTQLSNGAGVFQSPEGRRLYANPLICHILNINIGESIDAMEVGTVINVPMELPGATSILWTPNDPSDREIFPPDPSTFSPEPEREE